MGRSLGVQSGEIAAVPTAARTAPRVPVLAPQGAGPPCGASHQERASEGYGPLSEASGVTSESRFAYDAKISGFENSAISQRGSPPPAPPVAFWSLPRPPQPVRVVARLRKAYDLAEARCTQVLVRSTPSGCQGATGELLDGFRWQQFACRGRQRLPGHLRRRGAAQRALPRQDERLAVRTRQVRQHPKPPPFPPIMESATAGVRT